MIRNPKIRSCYTFVEIPGEGAVLLSETGASLISGSPYVDVAAVCDGSRSIEQILETFEGRFGPAEVFYALDTLASQGYLGESEDSGFSSYANLLNLREEVAEARLSDAAVELASVGSLRTDEAETYLSNSGIDVRKEADLLVVVTDDYLYEALAEINASMIERHRAWMPVKPVGASLWLGPVFRPGDTACWACLSHRIEGHRKVESFLKRRTGSLPRPPAADTVAHRQVAYGLLASEILRYCLKEGESALASTLLTVDPLHVQMARHHVVRRPQCPACGDPRLVTNRSKSVSLVNGSGIAWRDGGYRERRAEDTVARLSDHVDPVTGIIGQLQKSEPPASIGEFVHAYVADHNSVDTGVTLSFLRERLRGRSGGKGRTDQQARASAICESIERYAAIYQGDEPVVTGTYSDLDHNCVHPNEIQLFDPSQYESRDADWMSAPRHRFVPDPFDECAEVLWTPCWSLNQERPKYVPSALCYYGTPEQSLLFARADSSGTAAGNTLEEAILQGFLELVERDCVAIWWYNRLRRPELDLDSFEDTYVAGLREGYHRLSRRLQVLDVTNDLGIPAFAAVSSRTDGNREDIIFGFGCHFDPDVALSRALTELNQCLYAVPDPTSGRTEYGIREGDALTWWETATLENQPYLVPLEGAEVSREHYRRPQTSDLAELIKDGMRRVESRGMETLVVDMTRPDVDLHVARVIVPGLRHFWARFGPGRLYDVPVEMGWIDRQRSIDEINPTPVFF